MIIPRITTPEITQTWRSIFAGAGFAVVAEDIRYRNIRYLSFFRQEGRTGIERRR